MPRGDGLIWETGALWITLSRDGEELDQRLAQNPDEAPRIAILILAGRPRLYHGDTLSVRLNEDEA
jgi:hypothetical protein